VELPDGLTITAEIGERDTEVLTPAALDLIVTLQRELGARRLELLEARQRRRQALAEGGTLDFLPETAHIRADDSWTVAAPAPGLVDRRVEITGPTDRKMTVNALNSGAKTWLADQEDANTPQWRSVVGGQLNLLDAIERRIDFTNEAGKSSSPTRSSPPSSCGPAGGT
jgi:malate synthase